MDPLMMDCLIKVSHVVEIFMTVLIGKRKKGIMAKIHLCIIFLKVAKCVKSIRQSDSLIDPVVAARVTTGQN